MFPEFEHRSRFLSKPFGRTGVVWLFTQAVGYSVVGCILYEVHDPVVRDRTGRRRRTVITLDRNLARDVNPVHATALREAVPGAGLAGLGSRYEPPFFSQTRAVGSGQRGIN